MFGPMPWTPAATSRPPTRSAFLYIPSATLIVQTNGLGGITPVDNGKLLAIGTNYTLTASPGQNWLFSNWVGGSGSHHILSPTIQSYSSPCNPIWCCRPISSPTSSWPPRALTTASSLQPTRRASKPTPAPSPSMSPARRLVGQFGSRLGNRPPQRAVRRRRRGADSFQPRKGENPLTTTLQLDLAGRSVQGTVTDGSFVAMLHGDQAVFSSTHKATNYQGQYTLIIPGTNDPTVGPFGTSYGTVTVDASGNITFAGSLADGTTSSANPASSPRTAFGRSTCRSTAGQDRCGDGTISPTTPSFPLPSQAGSTPPTPPKPPSIVPASPTSRRPSSAHSTLPPTSRS